MVDQRHKNRRTGQVAMLACLQRDRPNILWQTLFGNRVGPKVKIYLDGRDEPVIHANFIELLTEKGFVPPPLAAYTARAGDLYLPIPFAQSCKITLDSKAFYNIINYRAYAEGTKVETFSMEQFQAAKTLLDDVGEELLSRTAA